MRDLFTRLQNTFWGQLPNRWNVFLEVSAYLKRFPLTRRRDLQLPLGARNPERLQWGAGHNLTTAALMDFNLFRSAEQVLGASTP